MIHIFDKRPRSFKELLGFLICNKGRDCFSKFQGNVWMISQEGTWIKICRNIPDLTYKEYLELSVGIKIKPEYLSIGNRVKWLDPENIESGIYKILKKLLENKNRSIYLISNGIVEIEAYECELHPLKKLNMKTELLKLILDFIGCFLIFIAIDYKRESNHIEELSFKDSCILIITILVAVLLFKY